MEVLRDFGSFPVFIAPSGENELDFLNGDSQCNKETLIAKGCKENLIGVAPERAISVRGGFQAIRKQISLKHVGAITIDKSRGDTIAAGIDIEISHSESCPFSKEHIVVAFRRTNNAASVVVVGDKEWSINKMWELITTGNQWSEINKRILSMVSINADGNAPETHMLILPRYHSFLVSCTNLPIMQYWIHIPARIVAQCVLYLHWSDQKYFATLAKAQLRQ